MVPYSMKGMSRRRASRDEPANPRRKSSDRISPAGSSSRPSAVETGNRSVRSCMGDPPKCREKSRSDPEGISPLSMHPICHLTIMERTSLYKKNPSPSLPAGRGRPELLAGTRKRKEERSGARRKNRSLRTDSVRRWSAVSLAPSSIALPTFRFVAGVRTGPPTVTVYPCGPPPHRRRGRALHGLCAERGEMARRKGGRVVADRARPRTMLFEVVPARVVAVELRRAIGMATRALRIHVDRPRLPVGRGLPAVAVHVGTAQHAQGVVEERDTAPGVVGIVERKVAGRDPPPHSRPPVRPVVVRPGHETQLVVAGVAVDRRARAEAPQVDLDGMGAGDVRVRSRCTVRRVAVAGGANPEAPGGGERRARGVANLAGRGRGHRRVPGNRVAVRTVAVEIGLLHPEMIGIKKRDEMVRL